MNFTKLIIRCFLEPDNIHEHNQQLKTPHFLSIFLILNGQIMIYKKGNPRFIKMCNLDFDAINCCLQYG